VFIRNEKQAEHYRDHGLEYVAGDDLQATRQYLFPPQDSAFYPDAKARDDAVAAYQRNREFFRERFWDNGVILAGGREYSALAISKCYRQGKLTCLNCHSMHESDPDDQLKPDIEAGAACVACHDAARYTTDVAAHTHHPADSAGSNCLNCHMPRTTYALFTAIRSHQIQSPDLAGSVNYGTPNACNLCHLDKTLAWTQRRLAQWYDSPRFELSTEQAKISAALVWMLKGNAAQRVIVAWHARWAPAQQASGADWLAPFVAPLLSDPYGVVRYVAEHSLRTLPGFENLKFDFLAPDAELAAAADQATAHWQAQRAGPPSRVGPEVLIAPDGKPSQAAIRWLLEHRDNRPVNIKE
jgi:predicted CXXCH cytochrome family protein